MKFSDLEERRHSQAIQGYCPEKTGGTRDPAAPLEGYGSTPLAQTAPRLDRRTRPRPDWPNLAAEALCSCPGSSAVTRDEQPPAGAPSLEGKRPKPAGSSRHGSGHPEWGSTPLVDLSRSLVKCGMMAGWVLACGVEPVQTDTGGVPGAGEGSCPSGAVVVLSDYASSQVALVGLDGTVLSESLVSSASSETHGLAYPLSGAVVLPSARPSSGSVVLIDRYGTNVITWIDPETAAVTRQMAVGTGFESNPQDYLEVGEGRAYVTRWGENAGAGREAFDPGSDVLILDTVQRSLIGRVELPRQDDLPPRPSRMARVGEQAIVVLQRLSLDFETMGPSQLVGIDLAADRVIWTQELAGLRNCEAPRLSPSAKRLAIACSGQLTPEGAAVNLDESGLALLDVEVLPPTLVSRFPASQLVGAALQGDLRFVSEELVLVKTQTPLHGQGNNALYSVSLLDGSTSLLLEARPESDGSGKGWVFGDVFCAPGCSPHCLLADADRSVLQPIDFSQPSNPQLVVSLTVAPRTGLPPRSLGAW
jgi:hypothetical protein